MHLICPWGWRHVWKGRGSGERQHRGAEYLCTRHVHAMYTRRVVARRCARLYVSDVRTGTQDSVYVTRKHVRRYARLSVNMTSAAGRLGIGDAKSDWRSALDGNDFSAWSLPPSAVAGSRLFVRCVVPVCEAHADARARARTHTQIASATLWLCRSYAARPTELRFDCS